MRLRGIVDVARLFPGCSRDQLHVWIEKCGCPDASMRVGNRRAFTDEDVEAIRRWLQATGKKFPEVAGV